MVTFTPRPIAMGPGGHRDRPSADGDGTWGSPRPPLGRSRWDLGVIATAPRPMAMGPGGHRDRPSADGDGTWGSSRPPLGRSRSAAVPPRLRSGHARPAAAHAL